jgi:hypothetical protein
VQSNDLAVCYPESISVINELVIITWLMVLSLAPLNPKLCFMVEMMMWVANKYPEYLFIPKEWYCFCILFYFILF